MKKIISATVLALGLAFTVAPAQADDHPMPPTCTDSHGQPEPCLPEPCYDGHGWVTSCDPCEVVVDEATLPLRQMVTAQRAAIERKNERIAKQQRIIERLRHRLHHR